MVAGDVWGAALSRDGGLNYLMSRGGSSGMRNLAVKPGLVDGRWYRQFGGSNGDPPTSYSGGIAVLTADSPTWTEWATPLLANKTGVHPRGVGNNIQVVRVGTATRLYIATNDGVKSLTDPGPPYAGKAFTAWAMKGPALPGALTHAIVVPDPVNKPLEVYVGVESGGPGPGLYRVTFNADGSPSTTTPPVRMTGSPSGRVDDIGSVIEDGVPVVYCGGINGVYRHVTGTNVASAVNGAGGAAPLPTNASWPWAGLAFKPMPTGRAVIYAACSPVGDAVLPAPGGNIYRTTDGGATWGRCDENAAITVKGDASGDLHYALSSRAQFRIGGPAYDVGSLAYMVGVAPDTDRLLVAGRTCVYGAEITTSTANPKGAVGRLSIYGRGINGSVAQGVTKDPIRGDVYGMDTDWTALRFIAYGADTGYTNFLLDRMPRAVNATSQGHGLSSGYVDARGCAWFGGGSRDDTGVGSIGYNTVPHLTTGTWRRSNDPSSPLALVGGGNVTGIGIAYLPSNYTPAAGGLNTGAPGDAVVMYSQPPTAGVAASGGMFTALVRFPAGTGVFTTNQAIASLVRPFQASVSNVSGDRTRFAIGRLGVNAAGTSSGAQGWVYALVMGVGLFRSSDYGNKFTLIDAAVPPASAGRGAGTLAQNPDDPDQLLYMGTAGPKRILNGRAATPTIEQLTALPGTTTLASVATVKDGAGDVHSFASRNVQGAQPGRVYWSGNLWTAAPTAVTWTQQDNDTFASIGADFHDMAAVTNPADGKPRIIMPVTDGGYMVGYVPTAASARTVEAPANLTAAPVGSTSMLLDWTAPGDVAISGYEVQRLVSGSTYTTLATYQGSTATTAHTDRNLTPGTSYTWRVRSLAVAPGVNSPYVSITRSTAGAAASPPTAVLVTSPVLVVEDGEGLIADGSESVAVAPATIASITYNWGDGTEAVADTDPFIPAPHVYESVLIDTPRTVTATVTDSAGLTGSTSATITQRPAAATLGSRNYNLPFPTVPGEPMYRYVRDEATNTMQKVWTPGPRLRQLVNSIDGLLFDRRRVEAPQVTFQGVGGPLTGPRVGKGTYYVEVPSELLSVRVTTSAAVTGAPLVLDIMRNGTSVFATTAERPTVAVGQSTSLTTTSVLYAAGDRVRVDLVSGSIPTGDLIIVAVRLRQTEA
jgi:hypothetical protein